MAPCWFAIDEAILFSSNEQRVYACVYVCVLWEAKHGHCGCWLKRKREREKEGDRVPVNQSPLINSEFRFSWVNASVDGWKFNSAHQPLTHCLSHRCRRQNQVHQVNRMRYRIEHWLRLCIPFSFYFVLVSHPHDWHAILPLAQWWPTDHHFCGHVPHYCPLSSSPFSRQACVSPTFWLSVCLSLYISVYICDAIGVMGKKDKVGRVIGARSPTVPLIGE